MSSRLQYARSGPDLDKGKISQGEPDIVGRAPSGSRQEWEPPADLAPPNEESPLRSRLQVAEDVGQVPTSYRVAAAGAAVVMVLGFLLGGRGDAAGSVTVERTLVASPASSPATSQWCSNGTNSDRRLEPPPIPPCSTEAS